jgi:methanogenic corrinoid protein MtbC1
MSDTGSAQTANESGVHIQGRHVYRPSQRRAFSADVETVVRSDVLPELFHRASASRALRRVPLPVLGSDVVQDFAGLVLAADLVPAADFIGALRLQGRTLESIYLDLLSPTARFLGDMWDRDLCHFAEVGLGLWRLHAFVREFSPAFDSAPDASRASRIFLTPLPGAQHSFGVLLVAEFFRRAGWNVTNGPIASQRELMTGISTNTFDVIGFSASCDADLEAIASCIHMVRRRSRNRAIGILVGGHMFDDRPDLVARVGADASAQDARQAVLQAANLVKGLGKPAALIV